MLVVDDEADARNLLAIVLESHGAIVQIASSAAEAFDTIGRRKPDVLLADLGMPQQDGFALIQKLRVLERLEQQGRLRAIAVTAYATASDRERALAAGYDAHVTKPFEAAELIHTIATFKAGQGRGA